MTSLNYIILAHKNPEQIKRLVNRLKHKNVNFYIHVDKSIPLKPFSDALTDIDKIYLLNDEERVTCHWADLGMVLGTIECIKRILSDGRSGYAVLLSGQDYPLYNSTEIFEFFKHNNGLHYISGIPLPRL